MKISRRRFLQAGSALAAYGVAGPVWFRTNGILDALAAAPTGGNKLLVLYLAGGNDGLNTVVPYGFGTYYAKRRTIAIPQAKVLTLPDSTQVGLHPKLTTLHDLYAQGRVAIVQGVGYDNPDLSHFGSADIWMTGSPTHATGTGWLGRWLDLAPDNGGVIRAVSIGYYLPPLLVGTDRQGTVVPGIGSFAFYDGRDQDPTSEAYRLHQAWLRCSAGTGVTDPQVAAAAAANRATLGAVRAVQALGSPSAPDPQTLADQVSLAVKLLDSALGIDVAFVQLGSFDDHYGENPNHDALLAQVDAAIARFTGDTTATGHPERFLLFTFSEFGRRVEEDGSSGTDHGTAAPQFVVGSRVKGGLYGQQPALDTAHLDVNGNLVRGVEIREMYATVIDRWLGGPSSQDVLQYSSADGLHPVPFL